MRIATDGAPFRNAGDFFEELAVAEIAKPHGGLMTDAGISKTELQALERGLRERRDLLHVQLENALGRTEEECRLALNEDVFDSTEEAMLADLSGTFRTEVNHLRRELAEIEAALERHATATYGICTECGRSVGLSRLLEHATALRCHPCQLTYERTPNASVPGELSAR